MKTNENSLQTAARWGWNGVKVVYAAHAVGSLLFPKQPAPNASKAARLDALEGNAERLDELLTQRQELQDVIKEALIVTLDGDEDAYISSAEFITQKAEELRGEFWDLAHEDYFPGASKAKCSKLETEMRDLHGVWSSILAVRKHQAYVAEEKFLVKTGAKSAFDSAYDKFGYASGKVAAVIAWTVLIGGVLFLIGGTIYSLCGGTFPQPQ